MHLNGLRTLQLKQFLKIMTNELLFIKFEFSLTNNLSSIGQRRTGWKQDKINNADFAFIILIIILDNQNGQVGLVVGDTLVF